MSCNHFPVSCDASSRSHASRLWEVMPDAFGKSCLLPLGSHACRLWEVVHDAFSEALAALLRRRCRSCCDCVFSLVRTDVSRSAWLLAPDRRPDLFSFHRCTFFIDTIIKAEETRTVAPLPLIPDTASPHTHSSDRRRQADTRHPARHADSAHSSLGTTLPPNSGLSCPCGPGWRYCGIDYP